MFEVMYLASGSIHKNPGNRINFIASQEGLVFFFFSSSSPLCCVVNAREAFAGPVTWEFVENWSGCGP